MTANYKKGIEYSLGTIITVALLLFFLIFVLIQLKPITSQSFHLGVQEQVCKSGISLSQLPGFGSAATLCHTQIVSFSEKKIKQGAKKGESVDDAALRQILNYMYKCKIMVNGPKRTGFLSENSCYICYSLQTDATTPHITEEDLASASVRLRAPTGKSYFFELNSENHWPTVMLNGGMGTIKTEISQGQKIFLGKDYAITYVSANKGSFWSTIGTLGTGAGVCALGLATWAIPYVGPVVAITVGGTVCKFSLEASTGLALFNMFTHSEQAEGTILFTDYAYLRQHACGVNANVIS